MPDLSSKIFCFDYTYAEKGTVLFEIAYKRAFWYDLFIVNVRFGGDFMARITEEQVRHVADLARLSITDEEAATYAKQLDAIITFAEQLNELDTENVEPTTHVLDVKNVLREDVVKESLPIEKVLKNAPDHQDGQVKVPSVLE